MDSEILCRSEGPPAVHVSFRSDFRTRDAVTKEVTPDQCAGTFRIFTPFRDALSRHPVAPYCLLLHLHQRRCRRRREEVGEVDAGRPYILADDRSYFFINAKSESSWNIMHKDTKHSCATRIKSLSNLVLPLSD